MNYQPSSAAGAGATTTTTTITETHVQTNLRWDPSYVRTLPGALKCAAVALDLIGFICAMCSGAYWRSSSVGEWYTLVSMTGFWTTGTLLVFYLLHVIEKFHVIPWLLIEMAFCALWAFFFVTTAIDTAVHASSAAPALGAASFFGFAAAGVYGFDAFLKFKGFRANQLAQGERTVQKAEATTAEVPAPNY